MNTTVELAHRSNNGIDVSLYWSRHSNQVTIEVFDSTCGHGFVFAVAGKDALDAFYHPYVYAPAHAVSNLIAAGQELPT